MQKHDREQLNTQAQRNYIFLRFRKGCKVIFTDWKKAIVFTAYVLVLYPQANQSICG